MLVIDTPDRKRVLAPRPAAAASKPAPRSGGNAHPVQPSHATTAARTPRSAAAAPSAARAITPPLAVRPRPAETLPQAIRRMLDQGYSAPQVEGELRRWHPDWSPTQIRATIKAAGNPTAFTPKTTSIPRTAGVSIQTGRGNHAPARRQQSHGLIDEIESGLRGGE